MNIQYGLRFMVRLLLLIAIICSPMLYQVSALQAIGGVAAEPAAYIEPSLATSTTGTISVIVSAQDAAAAARAVAQVSGEVTSQLWLIDAVAATVPANRLTELAGADGVRSVALNKTITSSGKPVPPAPDLTATTSSTTSAEATTTDYSDGWVTPYRYPVPWDGTPDVQPTSSWNSWKLAYPVKLEVGANTVYQTGSMVTVAVVDSGIYFDEQVKSVLGNYTSKLFLGQADFVDTACKTILIRNKTYSTGVQYADHCFNSYKFSQDPYGHGTHVAGIIWNRLSDQTTGQSLGIAFETNILGVRVLGAGGTSSYENVIQGIQYVVANKDRFNVRVLNLSLSATQTTPYFIDPLDRAVEKAWAAGIVVVAAAGNEGPAAETITVPGNDPYVITVGAVDGRRTPGYWPDDFVSIWSASGPTLDGFIKPDILAPGAQIVSFMYNSSTDPLKSAHLVQQHPDYSLTSSLYRMNGTSMATAVTSGVVALMLQAKPELTPDQVKYRLMYTARQMNTSDGGLGANLLQQGAGRLWAPEAVEALLPDGRANTGMDLAADLAAGWGSFDNAGNPVLDFNQLSQHYVGPVHKALSDDGRYALYYIDNPDGGRAALGVTEVASGQWLLPSQIAEGAHWSQAHLTWADGAILAWSGGDLVFYSRPLFDASGKLVWSGGHLIWSGNALYDENRNLIWSEGDLFDGAGHLTWSGGHLTWSGGHLIWSGSAWTMSASELFDSAGNLIWSGGRLTWSGNCLLDEAGNLIWSGGDLYDAAGNLIWSGGRLTWSGGHLTWSGGHLTWSGGHLTWSGGLLISDNGSTFDPSVYQLWSESSGLTWSGGHLTWSGAHLTWSGGNLALAGNYPVWSGGHLVWSGGHLTWSVGLDWTQPLALNSASLSSTRWVDYK